MKDKKDNIIYQKSFHFAIDIVMLHKELVQNNKEYVLSKQLLRSGTSIGANIKEALQGQSRKDFVAKMSIALKEAVESEYWLDLLYETDYITIELYNSFISMIQEIIRLLSSIVKTTKTTINN